MRIKATATENWKMRLSDVIVLTGSSKLTNANDRATLQTNE